MKKIFFIGFLLIFGFTPLQTVFSQASNSMILIRGGSFLMGSPEDEPGRNMTDEGPVHKVNISSFYMAKYPVTQAEYELIMGANPSQNKGENHPVERVSWNMAVEYCNKRSIAEGLTPVYSIDGNNVIWDRKANGYRLPTESEWEYACRAGTTTAYNTGSNITNNTGWYNANSGGTMQAVGQLPANRFGLFDMHGNVWEWCWDWYHRYPTHAETNPTGPPGPIANAEVFISQRIVRGGTFQHPPEFMRSAHRSWFTPDRNASNMAGFRIVRNAQ